MPAEAAIFRRFVGERRFRALLFPNGLPYVYVFAGTKGPEDGAVVVAGDLGPELGYRNLRLGSVRGRDEMERRAALIARLNLLPPEIGDRADIQRQREEIEAKLAKRGPLAGASMTLAVGPYALFGPDGKPVPPAGGKLVVPLTDRRCYLCGDGRPGSFAKLLAALRASRIEGYEPLAKRVYDPTTPIGAGTIIPVELTNVLNRPVTGALEVSVEELRVEAPARLAFAPHETKRVPVRITAGSPTAGNTYRLRLAFDAGRDGKAALDEEIHADVISRRTIAVDGKLDDWQGALPQPLLAADAEVPDVEETAWEADRTFDRSVHGGAAIAYLAYDANNLYFAAKAAEDRTPAGVTVSVAAEPPPQTPGPLMERIPYRSCSLAPARLPHGAKLASRRAQTTCFFECALPLDAIPGARQALAAGRPIRLSYRITSATHTLDLRARRDREFGWER